MTESTKQFWAKVYQTNIGKLIGICFRYTRNYQLSEDLAHDAFLKAIDKSGSFKSRGDFEAWLRRIVVNHALQYLRDRKKDPHLVDVMPDSMCLNSTEENVQPIGSETFTTAELIDTIDQLPAHHRLVFNLYVLEEFTHAQIGSALGISEGTSKSHLARARKKLQQLLTQRVEENKNERSRNKALVLLLAGDANVNIDKMFRTCFKGFSIAPQKPFSLESVQFNDHHTLRHNSFFKSKVYIIATSVIVSIVLIVVLVERKEEKPAEKVPVAEKAGADTVTKDAALFPSPTATISQDAVKVETNLKQKPMKPLDSLALMLALSSSGSLNAVAVKDSIRNQIEYFAQVEASLPPDSAITKFITYQANHYNKLRKERGTFRAKELFWSRDNNEVYFKGEVRVNFKRQRFRGNGSFTFLGKIHLLIVDGQEVELGRNVKLADADYELVTLDSKEASEKYGDKGSYGAVVVARK